MVENCAYAYGFVSFRWTRKKSSKDLCKIGSFMQLGPPCVRRWQTVPYQKKKRFSQRASSKLALLYREICRTMGRLAIDFVGSRAQAEAQLRRRRWQRMTEKGEKVLPFLLHGNQSHLAFTLSIMLFEPIWTAQLPSGTILHSIPRTLIRKWNHRHLFAFHFPWQKSQQTHSPPTCH